MTNEFDYYNVRAMGVRLRGKHLEYFLKFAQENNTKDVTANMKAIIDRLAEYESLEDVEFTETGFRGKRGAKAKELFLTKNEEPKKTLTFGELVEKPKTEPEPEPEQEPEELDQEQEDTGDDDEDVFII